MQILKKPSKYLRSKEIKADSCFQKTVNNFHILHFLEIISSLKIVKNLQ